MCKEVVVGSGVQTWAWSANISLVIRRHEFVRSIALSLSVNGIEESFSVNDTYGCWNLIASLAFAWQTILGSIVRVLSIVRRRRLVVGIVRALRCASRAGSGLLSFGNASLVRSRPWRLYTRHVCDPAEPLVRTPMSQFVL